MANGYVQHINPLFRPPLQQRFQRPPPPVPPPNDPSALFASQNTAQCMFPSAFPAEGPNIIQRFWIRLFTTLVYTPYVYIRAELSTIGSLLRAYLENCYNICRSPANTDFNLNAQMLILAFGENRWSIIIGLVVVVLASVGAYFFSPKGENNTIWRWVLILSFASCYLMWAITFLAQWHPLIQPRMTGLRPGYAAGS